ncbi:MAG TPA: PrsW family glutamic-type intramembrane protease [Thermoanaerobaculia bacterium]|nr:PrsW family glutamic-type intramembrane protease [Thermoanaerobaculia bacterium]HUM30430.1 PrsW family glutamic-type intramembrane protease [Thermoanaerobaculia bacterium]HXK68559.1 PrsW family glutamic-type intramembrane protease [Thermoanaerobaculia bacterium]
MKTLILILTLSFGPGLFWLGYFLYRDRLSPEPARLVMKVFFAGILSAVPAILFELPFQGLFLISTVFVAPVVEEIMKYTSVVVCVGRRSEFDEPMDGIVYASAAALGFASIENLFYLSALYGESSFSTIAFFRAVLTVPGHALWSSMWGFAYGMSRCRPESSRTVTLGGGLLLGIAFHALFNFLLHLWIPGTILLLAATVFFWRSTLKRISLALQSRSPDPPPLPVRNHPPHSES